MSKDASLPLDADGNPMAIVTGNVQDTVPTVQYGSVRLFGSVTRATPDNQEDRINTLRTCFREAEYAVGIERRSLQGAIDPNYKFVNPYSAEEQFAAPPSGYDPASMPPHPGDAANAKPAETTTS